MTRPVKKMKAVKMKVCSTYRKFHDAKWIPLWLCSVWAKGVGVWAKGVRVWAKVVGVGAKEPPPSPTTPSPSLARGRES